VIGAAASVVSLTIIVSCEDEAGVRIPHLAVYSNGFLTRSVPPSSIIELRGTGFRPGETAYVGVVGFPNLTKITVDKDGRFSTPSIAPPTAGPYLYVAVVSIWGEWLVAESVQVQVLQVEVLGGSQ